MNKEEILELNEYLGSAYDLADEFNVQVFCVNTQEFNNKVLLYYYRQVKTIDLLEKANQELKDRIDKAINLLCDADSCIMKREYAKANRRISKAKDLLKGDKE